MCFYEDIWVQRLRWTSKLIPVRFLDRLDAGGFFIEGYLRKVDKFSSEDQKALIIHANYPTLFPKEIIVEVKDIYPTKRVMTRMKSDGEIIEKEPILSKEKSYNPALDFMHPDTFELKVEQVFKTYPGLVWSMAELCSIINTNLRKDPIDVLRVHHERNCLMTGKKVEVYQLTTDTTVNLELDPPIVATLKDLKNQYSNCTLCSLGDSRQARGGPVVQSKGQVRNPRLFIIGEAPGVLEEENKVPFYSLAPAGEVLHKVLKAAGINDKEECYFTNAVWCRPAPFARSNLQNGKPGIPQIKACNSRLKRELLLVNPKTVLLLGRAAYRAFFGTDPEGGVMKNIGWVKSDNWPVYFLNHPSHIVRQLPHLDQESKNKLKSEYLEHFIKIIKLEDN